MSLRTTEPTGISSDRIRPEELNAILERLHREQEGLSVGDVAETLGMPLEQVEAAVAEIRRERVAESMLPKAEFAPRSEQRRRLKFLAFASSTVLLAGILMATYQAGRGAQRGIDRINSSQPMTSEPPLETSLTTPASASPASAVAVTPAEMLSDVLPLGMSVRIDTTSYQGANQERVYDSAAVHAALLDCISRLSRPASDQGKIDHAAISRELKSSTPVAVSGVNFTRVELTKGDRSYVRYVPRGPEPNITLGSDIDREIERARKDAENDLLDHAIELGRAKAP